jgi:hypothetical protein
MPIEWAERSFEEGTVWEKVVTTKVYYDTMGLMRTMVLLLMKLYVSELYRVICQIIFICQNV